MTHLILILKGGVIGVANIIPGVSGGTMAVVLGIYARLVEAIGGLAGDRARRWEHARLLALVGLGAIAAIGALSAPMDFMLTRYESQTYLFFIGLIAGSIPSVYRAHHDMRIGISSVAAFAAGAALLLAIAFAFPDVEPAADAPDTAATAIPAPQFGALLALFVAGIFAGGSMIVPGISGSFVMLLLGQYHLVIRAIRHFDVLRIATVGLGALVGVWAFARLISILLDRYPRRTFFFLLGLVAAALIPIFPGLPRGRVPAVPAGTVSLLLAAAVAAAGFGISYALGRVRK